MKINLLSDKTICSNWESPHNYFAWPTVTRLKDGRLAMVASGFRVWHMCPFGKSIISYSSDEGKTWTLPAILGDSPIDDRDSGIIAFGDSSVIVTNFTAGTDISEANLVKNPTLSKLRAYEESYLNWVNDNYNCRDFQGSFFWMSHDNGVTFGKRKRIPVTTPHGPAVLNNNTLLYVGNRYEPETWVQNVLSCYKIDAAGNYEYLCDIEPIGDGNDGFRNDEPHVIVLKSGKIIVHIRVQHHEDKTIHTIYQCESYDGGHSFTKPHTIGVATDGGYPAHIIEYDGVLISVYGHRKHPHQIRAMFSYDEGKTWDTDNVLVELPLDEDEGTDHGYPSSVALNDGSIMTLYYSGDPDSDKVSFYEGGGFWDVPVCVVRQAIWTFEKE